MLDEVQASLSQPPFLSQPESDYNSYTLGCISGHNVVVACLPSGVYGTLSASVVVSQMLHTFPGIRFGLMVGIAGGAPSYRADIRPGDVVVSRHLVQYDFGRIFRERRFQRTGALNKPSQLLLTALDEVRGDEKLLGKGVSDALQQSPNFQARFSKPSEDRLFQAEYNHQGDSDCLTCDKSQLPKREPRATNDPQVHHGSIASGNRVMKRRSDARSSCSRARYSLRGSNGFFSLFGDSWHL
jgi:nucleoside phosphorylase